MPASVIEAVNTFLDGAIFVVTLLIFYYVIKLIFVGGPENKQVEEGREQFKSALEKYQAESRKKKEDEQTKRESAEKAAAEEKVKKHKRVQVSPIKEQLHDALTHFDNIRSFLVNMQVKEAKKEIKALRKLIDKLIGEVRALAKQHVGNDHEYLDKTVTAYLHRLQHDILVDLKNAIPRGGPTWNNDISPVLDHMKILRGEVGNAWKHLEKFHK